MLVDGMKIQENLEWVNHIGNLIGYADFEEVELSYATFQNFTDHATFSCVFSW